MSFPNWPSWRYGPGGKSAVFESEADVPKGWEDHPTKVDGHPIGGGEGTATVPANTTTTPEEAAKSTEAKSQTMTDPKISATSGVGGMGAQPTGDGPQSPTKGTELDTDGHPFDPALHAATKSKTKDGKWRMKVGVARPEPAPGYPLDL